MTRRFIVLLFAIAAISVATSTVDSVPADAQGTSGPLLGAYAEPVGNESNIDAIVKLEGQLGTTLPMVRAFSNWDDRVGPAKPLHRWTRDGGRDLFLSVKAKRQDGSIITWSQIAQAQPGSRIYREMQALATGVRDYGSPVIFGFHHEPEQQENRKYGSNTEFRAAFRKLHSVFEAEGATNAQWAWIMTDWAFAVGDIRPDDPRVAERWYPGDDVVDIITSDPYNFNNCRGNTTDPWRSLEDNLAPLMRFLNNHPGKKLALAEFASVEGGGDRKAQWIREAEELFSRAPYRDTFVALMYFHDDAVEDGFPQCNWWLNTSNSSLQAASDWFKNDTFRSRLGANAPAPTPTTTRTCNGIPATLVGTPGPDTLVGGSGVDVIVGLGGDDIIRGLAGNDVICGGFGNDQIFGGGGADRLFGEAGRDRILGGYGPDTANGGPGNDRLNGQHGNDILSGDSGQDTVRGGPHADRIFGGSQADTLLGQGGWDVIYGDGGNDTISGGVGGDTISGGAGNDRCNGNQGRDTVRC